MDPHRATRISVVMLGAAPNSISGDIITADAMDAHNTFEQPNALIPVTFDGARIDGERLIVEAPAKSVNVLTLR